VLPLRMSANVTEIRVGVVEVLVLRVASESLEVLALRRAAGTRCTGAWEVVHGRLEHGEAPEEAAVREVLEETGLMVSRLYNVTCQPFYLHRSNTVQMAVVFGCFVDREEGIHLGPEHDRAEWVTVEVARQRLTWPRTLAALADAVALLGSGNAGPAEDVLRVR
jgi:dihydroneopterin triphosphate diphosphatase